MSKYKIDHRGVSLLRLFLKPTLDFNPYRALRVHEIIRAPSRTVGGNPIVFTLSVRRSVFDTFFILNGLCLNFMNAPCHRYLRPSSRRTRISTIVSGGSPERVEFRLE